MLTRNLVGGILSTAVGAGYLHYGYQLQTSMLDDSIGPRGLPLVYGWITVGLGLALCVSALVEWMRLPVEEKTGLMTREWAGKGTSLAWAGGLLAIAVAYIIVVDWLGYMISIGLVILAVALYLGARLGWRPLVIAIGGAIVLWLIFVRAFGVPMPPGMLPFSGL